MASIGRHGRDTSVHGNASTRHDRRGLEAGRLRHRRL